MIDRGNFSAPFLSKIMSSERRICQACAVHSKRNVLLQRSSVGTEMPGANRGGIYFGESPPLLKALSLLGVSICPLLRCYQRSWCWRWKLRAKGQLLGRTRALTAIVMGMFYINPPSDGAVLEAKTRFVPLPPCLSPGPGQCATAPALSISEASIICLCTFICRV